MRNDLPLLSIVTPSYNQGRFLAATLDSVHDQEYPRLEHVVIDGGSQDSSVEIIREHAPKLAYWVSERDSGQSEAINKGFRRATGDVVAWLNSDDVYLPGTLQTVGEFFRDNPSVDVVFGDYQLIDADGRLLEVKREIPFHFSTLLFGPNYVNQPTVFIRRRVIEGVGLLDEQLHYVMDWEWWLRMASANFQFRHIPKVLAAARWHNDCKTVTTPQGFDAEFRSIRHKYWNSGFSPVWERRVERILHQVYRCRRQLVKLVTRGTIDLPGQTIRQRQKASE